MPRGDIVLALLGASASLSGLLLVFVGFVVGAYGGLSDDTSDDVRRVLARAAGGLVSALVVGLICVASSTTWLVWFSHNQSLYDATVALFGLQLVGLIGATVWTFKKLLWRHHQRVTKGVSGAGD